MKLNPMKVKSNHLYTVVDLAKVYAVVPRTVMRWIKDGLPVFKSGRPYLIQGVDVKIYLSERNNSRKIKCEDDQIACLRCKVAVNPDIETIEFLSMTASTFMIKAKCKCGARLNKIASMKKRYEIFPNLPRSKRRLKD